MHCSHLSPAARQFLELGLQFLKSNTMRHFSSLQRKHYTPANGITNGCLPTISEKEFSYTTTRAGAGVEHCRAKQASIHSQTHLYILSQHISFLALFLQQGVQILSLLSKRGKLSKLLITHLVPLYPGDIHPAKVAAFNRKIDRARYREAQQVSSHVPSRKQRSRSRTLTARMSALERLIMAAYSSCKSLSACTAIECQNNHIHNHNQQNRNTQTQTYVQSKSQINHNRIHSTTPTPIMHKHTHTRTHARTHARKNTHKHARNTHIHILYTHTNKKRHKDSAEKVFTETDTKRDLLSKGRWGRQQV